MEILSVFEFELFEIMSIMVVTFIGSCIHEYVFRQEGKNFTLKNFNLWMSIFVSIVLCYIINPWIVEYNSRLILLPPLLFGLAGMDLVKRLVTIKGTSSLIALVLKTAGIKVSTPSEEENNDDNQPKEESNSSSNEEEKKKELEELVEVDKAVHENLDEMYHVLVHYYSNHDKAQFLEGYQTIKVHLDTLHKQILSHPMIPVSTIIALSEISKKETELDTLYHEIILHHDT